MSRRSAGVLLYRDGPAGREVLLAHPGGPFWAKKDAGAWSIPKGEISPDEEPRDAAFRELEEETGWRVEGPEAALHPIRQAGGKMVYAWAVRADVDPATLRSNTFTMEWPPRSGREVAFPEADRAGWFTLAQAREKILPSQAELLDQVAALPGPDAD